jgi:hypothetical protein
MAKRPVSANGLNKAMTAYVKKAAMTMNPRFLVKNIKITECETTHQADKLNLFP